MRLHSIPNPRHRPAQDGEPYPMQNEALKGDWEPNDYLSAQWQGCAARAPTDDQGGHPYPAATMLRPNR
jgi:hypothetical protein